jgi:hypothetical protein
MQDFGTLQQSLLGELAMSRNREREREKEQIARRTTGAKGCYFLADFLQVSYKFLKHFFKVSNKPLTIAGKSLKMSEHGHL